MILINMLFIIMAVGVIITEVHLLVTRDNIPTFERLVIAICIVINGGFIACMWGMVK